MGVSVRVFITQNVLEIHIGQDNNIQRTRVRIQI